MHLPCSQGGLQVTVENNSKQEFLFSHTYSHKRKQSSVAITPWT